MGLGCELGPPSLSKVDQEAVEIPMMADSKMGWDLAPFAAVLAPGQTSPPTTEYKETIRGWK